MRKILLVSFGKIDKKILDYIAKQVTNTITIKAEFLKELPVPWTKKRGKQLKASDLLMAMTGLVENIGTIAVIGITDKDIYMPRLNFVFGLASPKEKVAVVSLARLKSEKSQLFKKRIKKEILHEIGHILGLNHCPDEKCAMRFSKNIIDVDNKTDNFCQICKSHFTIY